MKLTCITIVLVGLLVCSCDLQQNPVDSVSSDQIFASESGLQTYSHSFYDILPSATDITQGDAMSDYTSRSTVPDFLRPGVYTPRSRGGWNWGDLRNINYFLENNTNPDVPEEVRQNYNGIARFFRAWFYFNKVKTYGNVPWIDRPLGIDDEALTAPRDPREEVMEHILEDINYAIEHIETQNESSRTTITRDVALALKSRITLFEGTYRKYHEELGLQNTADTWLQEAISAAETLIESGSYDIYTGSGVDQSYREIFTTDSPVESEVILSIVHDTELGVRHNANWWYASGTYGIGLSFIRPFIHTYLLEDGTPFTAQADYQTMEFPEEVQDRDTRLQQTIRMGDYMRIDGGESVPAPPAFTYTFSGYHPIKWTLDDASIDAGARNTNSVPIFRYAEILLNYAEAKAELGTITNSEWSQTIGKLRQRAGINNGTSTLPIQTDVYLQETYFPNISDPVLLEIRRERGIELALEGFRFDDIRRWKRGELLEMGWRGIYVSETNTYIDLNSDGNDDAYFFTEESPEDKLSGVDYVDVGREDLRLTDGNSGELIRLPDIERRWEDKKYLYPISTDDLQDNPNLTQNPGWGN